MPGDLAAFGFLMQIYLLVKSQANEQISLGIEMKSN